MNRRTFCLPVCRVVLAAAIVAALAAPSQAQLQALCKPQLGPAEAVVTAAQRNVAAKNAEPALVDIFAWPDGPFGVLKVGTHDAFFATDGGTHRNGKAGSVTLTFGSLADPLGSGCGAQARIDVSIQNDLTLDAKYSSYSYIGRDPIYLVPRGMPGAGSYEALCR